MATFNQQNGTNAPFNDITLSLADAIAQAQALLTQFFQSDDLESGLRLAFGDGILASALEDLAEQMASSDGVSLPTIEVRSPSELNGALGAFAAETHQIFLSESLFEGDTLDLAVAVLIEEIGHSLDPVLNPGGEAAGDEGAIFSAVVRGVELSEEQLQNLRQENDSATIEIDGQVLAVERATITVDTLVDEEDGSITDGDISLRDAIALASSGDTITFANSLLTGGTIALDSALGALDIETAVTINGDIDGDGIGDITIDGQGNSQVLNVYVSGSDIAVSLSYLTITGSGSAGFGGGIFTRPVRNIN